MVIPKPYHEERPWGAFIEFSKNTPSTVKLLTVNAGEALSLQKHTKRSEFWRIISGNGYITIGNTRTTATPEAEFFIPSNTEHRIEAGNQLLVVLEIAFGTFEDNDIIRLEDRYGRISAPNSK